jgi:dephospho-CoA kinase
MFKLGITGSIGAGKTTLSKLLEESGLPVFYSDLSAREAEKDPEIIAKLKALIGTDVFDGDVIIRDAMRKRVFGNPELLAKVNSLITPWVSERFDEFVEANAMEGNSLVIIESAVLCELDLVKGLDATILVYASRDTRKKRIMLRDGLTDEIAELKLNAQMSEKEKLAMTNFIVVNEDVPEDIRTEIMMKQMGAISATLLLTGRV